MNAPGIIAITILLEAWVVFIGFFFIPAKEEIEKLKDKVHELEVKFHEMNGEE